MLRAFFISIFILFNSAVIAQGYFVVNQVHISGNKKTKLRIISRELDINQGDTLYLQQIDQRFKENEKRILSTGLFTNVTINVKNWDTSTRFADVELQLIENWYIYPAPIFELADRNFNVWWNDQGRSLDRVNYGVRVSHINFSGNKDAVKLVAQFGYTRKFETKYIFPYLNEKKTWGFALNTFYSENKEIGYQTFGNKTVYEKLEDERILLNRMRISTSAYYRPKLFFFHTFRLEFHRNTVDEFVASDLNPDYFLNGRSKLRFFLFEYDLKYDRRIFRLYPEGGYLMNINVKKEGFGIFDEYNNLSVSASIQKYFNPFRNLVFNINLKGSTKINRDEMAFANNTGLGYGNNIVSGFELYVVDGTDYFLYQSSARFRLLDKLINYKNYMPLNQFRLMSLKIYFRFNFDSAYVNDPNYSIGNPLNNRWIYGFGPAIDVILFNNFLFQIEYSINDLGEKGIFLHNKVSF
jgi:outer membrane protein assembly factor BamA